MPREHFFPSWILRERAKTKKREVFTCYIVLLFVFQKSFISPFYSLVDGEHLDTSKRQISLAAGIADIHCLDKRC